MKRGTYTGKDGFTVTPVRVVIKGERLRDAANATIGALTALLEEAERADALIGRLVAAVRDGAGADAPTYLSGSSDKVYTLATMPTRYLENCRRMSDARLAAGLRRGIEAELARRGDR